MKNKYVFFCIILLIGFTGILQSQTGANFDYGEPYSVQNVYFFSPTYPNEDGWINIRKDNNIEFYSSNSNRTIGYENYGNTQNPVGYVSGNKINVGCHIFKGCSAQNIYVKGIAKNGFEFPAQLGVDEGDFVRYKRIDSDQEFTLDIVDYYDPFVIEWYHKCPK